MTFVCREWDGRRAGPSGNATGCRSMRRSWRRLTRSQNRSTSTHSAHAHDCAAITVLGIAFLALLAALVPPARSRGRLHHVAGGGGNRRQSAVVSAVACDAKAGALGAGGGGARTAGGSLAHYDSGTAA